MYNLAKLLTEQPDKLEQLLISFMKLLITLYLGGLFMGISINANAFINQPIHKSLTVIGLIKFLGVLIVVWHIIWFLFTHMFLNLFTLKILGKVFETPMIFDEILLTFNVMKKSNSDLIPDKNFGIFNEFIQYYNEEDNKSLNEYNNRLIEYSHIAIVVFIVLIFSNEIISFAFVKILFVLFVFVFLLGALIMGKFIKYLNENLEDLKIKFGQFSYKNKLNQFLQSNKFIIRNYEVNVSLNKLKLDNTSRNDSIPERIVFSTMFFSNKALGTEFLNSSISEMKKIKENKNNHFYVVVSNLLPNDELTYEIKKRTNFAYVICNDENEIAPNIEVLLFKIAKDLYEIR